ncbi:hypothetical protein T484DRAFT_1975249, partial [Baffinella frigidus]
MRVLALLTLLVAPCGAFLHGGGVGSRLALRSREARLEGSQTCRGCSAPPTVRVASWWLVAGGRRAVSLSAWGGGWE